MRGDCGLQNRETGFIRLGPVGSGYTRIRLHVCDGQTGPSGPIQG